MGRKLEEILQLQWEIQAPASLSVAPDIKKSNKINAIVNGQQ